MFRQPIQPVIALSMLLLSTSAVLAATEKEASQLARDGDFGASADAYADLVKKNPKSLRLRLDLADALAKDRQWSRAIEEYESVLKLSPNNSEALRGLGTVNMWRGHLDASRAAYEKARTVSPNDIGATLSLAEVETLDHDFAAADALYAQANAKWPNNEHVQRAEYGFRRQTHPRIHAFYEDDLSFRTEAGGLTLPLFSREELSGEYQKETRFDYLTGDESYARVDKTVQYIHYFGLNHSLELRARDSEFEYPEFTALPDYATIHSYQEYRIRYTLAILPEQVVRISYTARPTALLTLQNPLDLASPRIEGDSFTAHKVEVELNSSWTPRFRTLLGTGWLRDLDATAANTNANADTMVDETLLKIGFQYDITNRLDIGARFITNPDLDSSVHSTTLAQVAYSISDSVSLLLRDRFDDYISGDDQNSIYAGIRFTPGVHLWSEFGAKYVKRGIADGTYPLASVVLKF